MKKKALFVFLVLILAAAVSAQTINLNQPNGGEKWKLGETKQIKWTASGLSHNMRVLLLKNGQKIGTIADNVPFVPGQTNYTIDWPVGTYIGGTAAAGSTYKIRVREKQTTVIDASNSNFEILSQDGSSGGMKLKPGALAGIGEIKVTSPNASSYWDEGSTYTIRWETALKQAFKIELYKYNKRDKLADIATMLLIPGKDYDGKYSFKWYFPTGYAHAPGRRTIKISTADGNFHGFSSIFSLRVVGTADDVKKVYLYPDSMERKAGIKYSKYDISDDPANAPKAEDHGLGNIDDQLRVGYASNYHEGSLEQWWWWRMVFRSKVHFDLSQYTGDKIFLVKATLYLDEKNTIDTLSGQNHCALGLWQLTGPWTDFMSAPVIHILNISQMGGAWSLDVTSQVREWVQGMRDNDGFLITGINENPGKVTEKCVSYFTARLDLEYIEK